MKVELKHNEIAIHVKLGTHSLHAYAISRAQEKKISPGALVFIREPASGFKKFIVVVDAIKDGFITASLM